MKYSESLVLLVLAIVSMCSLGFAQYDEECHYECATTYCDLFDDYCDYDCYEVCYHPYRFTNVMRSRSDGIMKTASKASEGTWRPIKTSSSAPVQQPAAAATFSSASAKARTGKIVKMRIQNPSIQQATRGKVSAPSSRNHLYQTGRIALFQSCLSNSRQESAVPHNS